MATAKEERAKAARGEGCLGKAADDEPVFILRGQDKFAPWLVRLWAVLACIGGASRAKVAEAFKLAAAMRAWPIRKRPD
jgi:hypothetical protein